MKKNSASVYLKIIELFREYITDSDSLGEMLLAGYLTKGHVLLEGPPGVAKTSAVKVMGALLGRSVKRVQFTPDLMPTDILGYMLPFQKSIETKSLAFKFIPGPVFCDIFIADEINRAPARTQSALLEAMEERIVSVDGKDYQLDRRFWVLATENPREMEGTYPLPEAEIDRFAAVLRVGYLDEENEKIIARKYLEGLLPIDLSAVRPFSGREELHKTWERDYSKLVYSDNLISYAVSIIRKTRDDEFLRYGASSRALFNLLSFSGAMAVFDGRDYVDFDDVKKTAVPVLAHRIKPLDSFGLEIENAADNIKRIIDSVEVPR